MSGDIGCREHVLARDGASGHGKVVADLWLSRRGNQIDGFIDDRAELRGKLLVGIAVVGTWEALASEAAAGGVGVLLGIGDNRARKKVAERCLEHGIALVTGIHASASVAPSSRIGEGTVIMAGAAINPDAEIGRGAIVNTGAVVEHDVRIGDFAHLSPNAATGGAARLGALSHLGLGAIILPGVSVGSWTTVGAGGVVDRDLPDGVVAYGVPARVHRPQVVAH